MIAASRFSYRLFLMEKRKVLGKKDAQIRAMIIGTGGTAKTVRRELEREDNVRLMCVLNYKKANAGSLFDGIPVVNGIDQLKSAIEKYQINYVILASASMAQEIRSQFKELCNEISVEAQDYTGFFQNASSHTTLRNLAEFTKGPVEIIIHDRHLKLFLSQR
jgi:FlaA1/EpsC-like NDP-sugar epimerase